jgi:anti-sigma factor ChrR (cupin superfamily)
VDEALHGDMTIRTVVDTTQMDWTSSPSGSVLRKRLHRVGGAESGQVTSLVRYLPGASFPEHPHPEGEEILVLEGTFSDQAGDAQAGSHLLNPEGFRHAPYSEAGCLIFVKLRQYSGVGRPHLHTESESLAWAPSQWTGIEEKILFADHRFPDVTRLERWAPGVRSGPREFDGGAEIFVIEGELADTMGRYAAGTWLRLPVGSVMDAASETGCRLYLKTGALPGLRASSE